LTLAFKFKFDNFDSIDCTEIRVELFEEDTNKEFCVEDGGMYLGVDMCRSRYQVVAGVRYGDENKLHKYQEYINMIDAVPSFNLKD